MIMIIISMELEVMMMANILCTRWTNKPVLEQKEHVSCNCIYKLPYVSFKFNSIQKQPTVSSQHPFRPLFSLLPVWKAISSIMLGQRPAQSCSIKCKQWVAKMILPIILPILMNEIGYRFSPTTSTLPIHLPTNSIKT